MTYSNLKSSRNLLAGLLVTILLFPMYLTSQDLTIISPNGGENYMYGSSIQVTWQNNGPSEDLMLEYTDNGGNYWYYLAYISAGDSSNSLVFQNYLNPTVLGKVRIYYYNDPSNGDESDGYFTVTEPSVYVYNPAFGSVYYRNQEVYLSWFSYTVTLFNVDYSLDNGTTWSNIVSDYTGTELIWTAPDQATETAFIRVSDAADPTSYGMSPVFAIRDLPVITLATPNGGEVWSYGSNATVSWTGSNLNSYIYIDFSADGGATWTYLGYGYSGPQGGSAEVWVPYAGTENALVKVYDAYVTSVADVSDAVFTVDVPPVIIQNPYEGSVFYNNSDTYVNWITAPGIEFLDAFLSTDNGQTFSLLKENIQAQLGYDYITISGTPSETCILKLADASDPAVFGVSPVFTILPVPVYSFTTPAGGEIFNTESLYTISWVSDIQTSTYLYLEYSTDNGATWNPLNYILHEGFSGSYEWTTPLVNSDQCQLRLTDWSVQSAGAVSEVFTILTFPQTPICMVSVDSTTNRNVIVWDKPASDLIDKFIVYKESNIANEYEVLGTVDYNSASMIMDTNSNPSMKPYRYKLGFSNADGILFPAGDYHQTIHLTINQGVGNSWNLLWTDYVGFEVPSYNVYRKSGTGSYQQIASISASFTSYTDLTAPAGDVYYIIEVVNPNGCSDASRAQDYSSSYSNVATNSTLGVADHEASLQVSVYPNPASKQINILAGVSLSGNMEVSLSDLLGREVFRSVITDLRPGMNYSINAENLKDGLYILGLKSDKGSYTGKVVVKH